MYLFNVRPIHLFCQSTWISLVLLGSCAVALPASVKWEPVPPEDLAAKDCAYDPGVSAELLFVRQVLDASANTEWVDNYRRIKIYNLKGAEEMGVMSIDYPGNQKVWNLSAPVVKASGEAAEYGQKNFNETVSAKYKGSNWKRWTLAVPHARGR